jgi:hypothetical protein
LNGENKGIEGMNIYRGNLHGADGHPRLARWVFRSIDFEFEISAEGIAVVSGKKLIPTNSKEWRT